MAELVERIVTINRAWKLARDDKKLGPKNSITKRLQHQKSSWQATLIRSYPQQVWLKRDEDHDYTEPLLSVRISSRLKLLDGSIKEDAEHLPLHLAQEILTEDELHRALRT
jgi:hypothetical protein